MKSAAVRTRPCIALIVDMVGSREVSPVRRRKIQEKFTKLILYLNSIYSPYILSKFVITLGDEFQGLLSSATPIPDLMWDIQQRFLDRDLRVGAGFGVLFTPTQEEAINVDGPALHNARAAIEKAKDLESLGGVFVGFGEMDHVMDGLARILSFHRSKLTRQQLRILELLRHRLSLTQIADQLGTTPRAVSKQVLLMGWRAYAAAELAWRVLIEKRINPGIQKKRAKIRG